MKHSIWDLLKRHQKLLAVCGISFLLLSLCLSTTEAQIQDGWTPPFRLSSGQGSSSPATLITDNYGFLHAFWVETLDDERSLLQYARFDGRSWSVPNDIYITRPFLPIKNIAASLAPNGRLYIMWPEGDNGPVYFSSAPVLETMSASDWEAPYRVAIRGNRAKLQIDSKGVFHVLYSQILGQERGVYYVYSEDEGVTWSRSKWLDPDISPEGMPSNLEFVIDEDDGLHATWYYFSVETLAAGADWVRYVHSLDGGKTWSLPFTIDRLDESDKAAEKLLSAADPVLIVQDKTVHVIWAGGVLHYRNHRYSVDRGETWSPAVQIFDELNGQAGDGMAIDGAGRVHLFTQIRFPMGIYHAIWDRGDWSRPTLIYLIQYASGDGPGDNIGAHFTLPAILAGNQIILTLTDPPSEPGRKLYFTQHTLEDVTPVAVDPTPTATATPTPEATATPTPPAITPVPSFDQRALPPGSVSGPEGAVWLGVGPVLLLVFGAVAFAFLRRVAARS